MEKQYTDYPVDIWIIIRVIQVCNEYNAVIVAFASVAVAIFTYTLWKTSGEQAVLTRESVKIANRTLTDIERPWLFGHVEHGTKRIETPFF